MTQFLKKVNDGKMLSQVVEIPVKSLSFFYRVLLCERWRAAVLTGCGSGAILQLGIGICLHVHVAKPESIASHLTKFILLNQPGDVCGRAFHWRR